MSILESIQKGDIATTTKGYITDVRWVEKLPSTTEKGTYACRYQGSSIFDMFSAEEFTDVKQIGPRVKKETFYVYQLCNEKILKTKIFAYEDTEIPNQYMTYKENGYRNAQMDFSKEEIGLFNEKTLSIILRAESDSIIKNLLKSKLENIEDIDLRNKLEKKLSKVKVIDNYDL